MQGLGNGLKLCLLRKVLGQGFVWKLLTLAEFGTNVWLKRYTIKLIEQCRIENSKLEKCKHITHKVYFMQVAPC